jgi:hypothetical protein
MLVGLAMNIAGILAMLMILYGQRRKLQAVVLTA